MNDDAYNAFIEATKMVHITMVVTEETKLKLSAGVSKENWEKYQNGEMTVNDLYHYSHHGDRGYLEFKVTDIKEVKEKKE